ncbi:MAG: ADP-ribosylglycohydrolase family protein [Candidatus Hydrogenedentota bacterium]
MLGAIAGDIIGSVFEFKHTKQKNFKLFSMISTYTDDTVLTVATADALMSSQPYSSMYRKYALRYPMRGYGPRFLCWVLMPWLGPYNSFGNGSAMRISPIAYAYNTETEVLCEAERSAICTHNHPEGIKGAQATALAIFLARTGLDKESIRKNNIQKIRL